MENTKRTFTQIARDVVKAAFPSPVASVRVVDNLQPTKESLPLNKSFPRATLGDSGTRMLHGIIIQEYNSSLQGVQGIKIYDEMRKGDGTVRAAMLACTLPILRANWFVNPATGSEQDKEIANFVQHALFDWLDLSWNDILRQSLLMLPFGVMLFEKIYTIKEHDGKKYVTLEKLAPRLPQSIMQWELVDGTFGIQQIRQDGVVAQIPGSKLLIFVNEREGDNWWGSSMLRPAYKHWYFKNNFYKIDAIAFERQGLGIPQIKMPEGYTPDDEAQAAKTLKNLRANEQGYLLLPPKYEASFMDMGGKTTRDPTNSINHHNKEILQSVLAQFLELGQNKTGSGSKALSSDHSDLFLKATEAVAGSIASVFNTSLLKELVDLNFNDVKAYPVLDYANISKVDIGELGKAYSELVTAGALTPTDDDQQYMRAILGLPPRTQEQMDEENDGEPSSNEQSDHKDIDTDNTKTQKTDTEKGQQADKEIEKQKKKASFSAGKGFESWRPLTFAENKVEWSALQSKMDEMEQGLTSDSRALLTEAKDKFMTKIHTAIEENDAKAIAELEITFVNAYKALLKEAMKAAYAYGKQTVSQEMGVQTPANKAESMAHIDALADTIANKTAIDLETKAKLSAVSSLKRDTSVLQTVGAIDLTLEEAITTAVRNTVGTIIGQAINDGRNDVFQRNLGMIYALQRSEVLDERTCEFCLSMDNLIVDPGDTWADTSIFHTNCRGIWVEILNDEQNPPDITGVPNEVGDYYGGEVNSLIQPPKAIVRDGSPAAKEVAKREAEKAIKKNKK